MEDDFDPNGYVPDLSQTKFEYGEVKNEQVNQNTRAHPEIKSRDFDDSDEDTENEWLIEFYSSTYPDNAKKVQKDKVRTLPFQAIVKLVIKFKNKELIATGVLVGPKHVLTAHSNIHQKNHEDAISVQVSSHIGNTTATMKSKFTFGLNESTQGLLHFKNTDLALLILDKTIGKDLGYLPMHAINLKEYYKGGLFLAGIANDTKSANLLASNTGTCLKEKCNYKEGILLHNLRSESLSLAGSPIYIDDEKGKSPKIIAIQSYKELKGILLTKDRIDIIQKKIKETST